MTAVVVAIGSLIFSPLPVAAAEQPYIWTPNSNGGSRIATSVDGTKLARVYDDYIYTSDDSGQTWRQTSAPRANWEQLDSSADGRTLIAGEWTAYAGNPYVYLSNDGGQTWTQQSSLPSGFVKSVASSTDGKVLIVSIWNYGIYISIDGGTTWTVSSSASKYATAVAASPDGSTLFVASHPGNILISTDCGASWTQTDAPAVHDWESQSIASSTDGTVAIAAQYNGITSSDPGLVYTSHDHGQTWLKASLPLGNWIAVAASADGMKLVVMQEEDDTGAPGSMYISIDSGQTWGQVDAPSANWGGVAMSGDGSRIYAVQNGGMEVGALKSAPVPPAVDPIIAGATTITGMATPGDTVEATFSGGLKARSLVRFNGRFLMAVPQGIVLTTAMSLSLVDISADSGITGVATQAIVQPLTIDRVTPGNQTTDSQLANTGQDGFIVAFLGIALLTGGICILYHKK